MLITDRRRQLERLRGASYPAALFQDVPGIGPELASRILETLEDHELAARDGRLETVDGVGPRRVASIRAVLDELLSRRRAALEEPPVGRLLDVDRLYRPKAAAGGCPPLPPNR